MGPVLYMMILCGAADMPCPPLIYAKEAEASSFAYERRSCIKKIKLVHAHFPNYVGYCVRRDGKEVINELGEVTDLKAAASRWEPLSEQLRAIDARVRESQDHSPPSSAPRRESSPAP